MSTSILVVAGLALLVVLWKFSLKLRAAMLMRSARESLSKTYAALTRLPTLEFQWEYGYPAFAVTFANAEELAIADSRGMNDAFVAAVQSICKRYDSTKYPFDARRAVYFEYPGWLEDGIARHKQAAATPEVRPNSSLERPR